MASRPNADGKLSLISGALFDFDNPSSCDLQIEDLALSQANLCRFVGQTIQFYSVAQHAVNCSLIVEPQFAYTALMHEISEPFIGDIPSPVKWRIPAIRDLAHNIEADLAEQFGYIYPFPPEIKVADLQMMRIEKEHVKRDTNTRWGILDGIRTKHLLDKVDLTEKLPTEAFGFFMRRYHELRLLDVQRKAA